MKRRLGSTLGIALVCSAAVPLPAQDEPRTVWRLELGAQMRALFGERAIDGAAQHVRGPVAGMIDLSDPRARVTFGPDRDLGVDSRRSFTLNLDLRTRSGDFATALMCRDGGRVHYSLVLGRDSGRISFEVWSWTRDRATSVTRIDDGEWHRIEACHDADSHQLVLLVDGAVEAVVPVSSTFDGSPEPALRIGDNLDPNVRQPFAGELRAITLADGVSAQVRNMLGERQRALLLEPGRAELMVRAWNDRHRPDRDPSADVDGLPKRRAVIQSLVQDALGLWPAPFSGHRLAGAASPLSGAVDAEPTAFAEEQPALSLDRRDGGSLLRDGYRVTRTYWRTFEGCYASGWLYEPTTPAPAAGRAAVLCPHGHWSDGARHPVVQSRCITLAKRGYVVLAVDSLHVYDDRVALSPVAAMTWANLRGLELLRDCGGVDPERIGCTGASGGGQQTYYLTGLDSGLAAAVPAVMVCHLKEILDPDGVHCACNHVPHLARVLDVPELSAAFAPRPQLFLSVTGDWTHRFPAEGFPAIEKLYEALGAADRVAGFQWDHGHDYDRPMRNAMYAFFEHWLGGVAEPDREIEPENIAVEEPASLRALDRADVPQDLAVIAKEFRARLAVDPLDADVDRPVVRARLGRLFGPEPSDGGWRPSAEADAGDSVGGFVRADPDVELPVLTFGGVESGSDIAIVVSSRGKADVVARSRAVIDALAGRCAEVWVSDIRYTGELDVGRGFRDLHGRFFGLDEGQLAVADLRALVRATPSNSAVTIVAFGSTGVAALFASTLEQRVDRVIAPELGPTYRAVDRTPRLARVLLHGDLPEAAFASGATRIVLGGVGATSEFDVVGRLRPEAVISAGALTDTALMDLIGSW